MWRLALLWTIVISALVAQPENARPELLSYAELVELSGEEPSDAVLDKLDRVLAAPIVNNAAAREGVTPKRPVVPGLGPAIRVALWNLARGSNLDQAALALEDPSAISKMAVGEPERIAEAQRQAQALSAADVVLVNEADLGVSRSGYIDVTEYLAKRLRMNYAFGVEFVEVDPLLLGIEEPRGDPESVRVWSATHRVDKAAYRGLHGNAILSRYPITRARVLRLPECYDWFGNEKQEIALLEKGRRWTARRLFEERIAREVRRGGRMALIAELAVPEAPEGKLTVVSTHLENKCRPACRRDQMDTILAAIKEAPHAVVVGGDLNTTGTDAAPTSLRREIARRAGSLQFWLGMIVRYLSPGMLPQIGFVPANHFKNFLDPTIFHMPIMLPNREDRLFTKIRRFRFSDGGAFDFTGSPRRTVDRRSGTLANSNQRRFKGFRPTYRFERTLGGIVGRYKLDWFFVKPGPDGALVPHFPLTMNELNEVSGARISDHSPLTVDLPLLRPQ